jgi:hypothetical protein
LEDLKFAVLDESGSIQMRRGGRKFVKELEPRTNDYYEDGEIGMQAAIDRAGKWAKRSGSPRKHYLAAWEDRGPLAIIHSWEERIPIGGDSKGGG